MLVKFQQFDNEKLLIQKYSGKWNINDFKEYIDMNLSLIDWTKVEKVLTDFYELEDENIINYLDELMQIKNDKLNKETRNISMSDKPIITAFLTLYSEEQKKQKHKYEVCSTIDYAISSLELNLSKRQIEKMISELKYTYKGNSR